jgi:hypothetical protein
LLHYYRAGIQTYWSIVTSIQSEYTNIAIVCYIITERLYKHTDDCYPNTEWVYKLSDRLLHHHRAGLQIYWSLVTSIQSKYTNLVIHCYNHTAGYTQTYWSIVTSIQSKYTDILVNRYLNTDRVYNLTDHLNTVQVYKNIPINFLLHQYRPAIQLHWSLVTSIQSKYTNL